MHLSPSTYVVLCFGHYVPLLVTRQRMLEREGYSVVVVSSQEHFREAIRRSAVGLVLLCQTLSDQERREAVLFLADFAPDARCAVLHTDFVLDLPHDELIAVDVSNGPSDFIQTIVSLLPSRPPGMEARPASRVH